MGEINSFYTIIPGWDTMLHTINGFLVAAVGFCLVDLFNRSERFTFKLSPLFLAIVAFCFSMTIGVLWEFFEWGMDNLAGLDMQKDTVLTGFNTVMLDPQGRNVAYHVRNVTDTILVFADGSTMSMGLGGYLDIGLMDTMKDLLVNLIGAVVFSFFGYFYVKSKGKGKVARNFIPNVLEHPVKDAENPEKTEEK